MIILTFAMAAVLLAKSSHCISCNTKCPPEEEMVCGFDAPGRAYKMFPGKCAMQRFMACNNVEYIATPVYFCIKSDTRRKGYRRDYFDYSCPVFCPHTYRPVCAASSLRSYEYRSFTNGCQLDLINCRGNDQTSGYFEVPLSYCPDHAKRNIFKDQIIAS